jgi:hypothetical protein
MLVISRERPRENRAVDEATMARTPGSAALLRRSDAMPTGIARHRRPPLVGSVEDSSRQLLRRVILQESRIAQAS